MARPRRKPVPPNRYAILRIGFPPNGVFQTREAIRLNAADRAEAKADRLVVVDLKRNTELSAKTGGKWIETPRSRLLSRGHL